MSKIFFSICFLSSFLLLTVVSCKGPAGAQGPIGPAGPVNPIFETTEDGFINFTISGNRQDGTPFSYTESFKTYLKSDNPCTMQNSASSNHTSYVFNRGGSINDLFDGNSASIDLSRYGTGNISSYTTIRLKKTISSTQEFRVSFSDNAAGYLNYTLNYDATTHKITGTFSGTVPVTSDNTTGHPITITNGTFESSVVEVVNRPAR